MVIPFLEKLDRICKEFPDFTAIIDEKSSITYRELNDRTHAVAHLVSDYVVDGEENLVALLLPRELHFPVAALACLKAGAGYIPLSLHYPADRINMIIGETCARLLITTRRLWESMGKDIAIKSDKVLFIEEIDYAGADFTPIDKSRPENLAFILFTSGTTGKPKGVVYDMDAFNCMFENFTPGAPAINHEIKNLVIADFTFIASVRVLYGALYTAGVSHIIEEETFRNIPKLVEYINKNDIAICFLPSQLGIHILQNYKTCLKRIYFGGEKMPSVTSEVKGKSLLANTYGMSECTPMTLHVMNFTEKIVPAGKPVFPINKIYILDKNLKSLGPGEIGEICFSAAHMAKGYYKMPELSAERFIDNPFESGTKLLRTGDRGYLNEDGEVVISGRSDNMIKLRGQRIETGEVENCALTFGDIQHAACMVRKIGGDEQLCLYFDATSRLDKDALREYMASKLTSYMVPVAFVQLDRLPLNARGKIDRTALPEPKSDYKVLMIPPANEKERTLFDVAAEELGHREFGVTDNLFDMGMTSLMAMKMIVNVERQGIKLKTSDLMHYKSIRDLLIHNMQMVFWYNYDESKPIMVLPLALILFSDAEKRISYFSQFFSVLVIEPVAEHYNYLFVGDYTDEVVRLYYAAMDAYLPKDAQIAAFAGFSFGGKIAYLLAERWKRESGQSPRVLIGDTYLIYNDLLMEALRNDALGMLKNKPGVPQWILIPTFTERLKVLALLEQDKAEMPAYDGPVLMVYSTSQPNVAEALALWKSLCPNIETFPVNNDHLEICLDNDQTLPLWFEIAEKISVG